MKNIKNVAVILAGGKGERFSNDLPKQFIKIAGKKVIEHTIDIFQNNNNIDEIIVVCNELYISQMEDLARTNNYNKIKKILKGGTQRYHSSLSAINSFEDNENVNLLFHDAVRPLLSNDIINKCIELLSKYNVIDVAIPSVDTMIDVDLNKNIISGMPDRKTLYRGQTPQAFKLKTIREAYNIALKDTNFSTTDDCGVVFKYLPNEYIYVLKGEESNMKLTYKEDVYIIDKLFQLKNIVNDNILNENDRKIIKNKNWIIFGGSSGIGKEIVNILNNYTDKVYSFSKNTNGVDVTDFNCVKNTLEEIYKKDGKIDIIINTVGILHKQSLNNISYKDINESINVNYLSCVIIAKESLEYLKKSKGSLLMYTSSSFTRGREMYGIYSSLKSAIVNFTQSISSEWSELGIRVNCMNPERTKTPMRIKNFGIEPDDSLLSPNIVAMASIKTAISNISGMTVDVNKIENDII